LWDGPSDALVVFNWLKHAFAVEPSRPVEHSPTQTVAIDAVCREIVRRGMALPEQMVLDSSAPLSYLAGQSLRIFEPFLGAVLDPAGVREFAGFLEKILHDPQTLASFPS